MDAGTESWRQHAAGAAKWINRREERVRVGGWGVLRGREPPVIGEREISFGLV